jgi:hypothetical protein
LRAPKKDIHGNPNLIYFHLEGSRKSFHVVADLRIKLSEILFDKLILAVEELNIKRFNDLMALGVNINKRSQNGKTALSVAMQEQDFFCMSPRTIAEKKKAQTLIINTLLGAGAWNTPQSFIHADARDIPQSPGPMEPKMFSPNTSNCQERNCNVAFSLWKHPHHCRNCNRVVCDHCSKNKMGWGKKKERVCNTCFSRVAKPPSSVLSEAKMLR